MISHFTVEDDADFIISDLIGDSVDVGDELMTFMESALQEESTLGTNDSLASTLSPNIGIQDITNKELCVLIEELKDTHTVKSLGLSSAQEVFFYDIGLWRSFFFKRKRMLRVV